MENRERHGNRQSKRRQRDGIGNFKTNKKKKITIRQGGERRGGVSNSTAGTEQHNIPVATMSHLLVIQDFYKQTGGHLSQVNSTA